MSEEREVLTNSGTEKAERTETKSERKARLAAVLERGYLSERLQVPLPDNMYGEWVPKDHAEITRKELLGFRVDQQYGLKQSLHSDGTPITQIGDVVFMVTSRENKELLDEIRNEQYERRHGKIGATEHKTQDEEKSVIEPSEKLGVPTIQESSARVAKKAEIEAVLGNKPR
jgi:hypothetical protein